MRHDGTDATPSEEAGRRGKAKMKQPEPERHEYFETHRGMVVIGGGGGGARARERLREETAGGDGDHGRQLDGRGDGQEARWGQPASGERVRGLRAEQRAGDENGKIATRGRLP